MRSIQSIFLGIVLLACAGAAAAQGTCSTEMLQGNYVVEHTGLVYMNPVSAPYSLLGSITADAAGNLDSAWLQVSAYGSMPYPQHGYWTVTPDCKVTMKPDGGATPATSEGYVIKNGEEIRLMLLAPMKRQVPSVGGSMYPSVGSGILHRVTAGGGPAGNCDTKMLRGTYAHTCSGFAVTGTGQVGDPYLYVPFRTVGTVIFAGDGSATGAGKLISNAQLSDRLYSSFTYTVAPSCWATATFQIGASESWNETMLVYAEGKEMISTLTSGPTPPGPTRQVNTCRYTRIDH